MASWLKQAGDPCHFRCGNQTTELYFQPAGPHWRTRCCPSWSFPNTKSAGQTEGKKGLVKTLWHQGLPSVKIPQIVLQMWQNSWFTPRTE